MALKKSLHSLDFYLRALFQYKANLLVFDFQFISNGLMVQKKKKKKEILSFETLSNPFPSKSLKYSKVAGFSLRLYWK